MLYRIAWKISNGFTGAGEYCLNYSSAMRIVISLNKNNPDIHHWVESIEPYYPENTYCVLGGA